LHDGVLEVALASLTLKNLPDELLGALREAAEKDRRSLTQEIIHLLEGALRDRDARPPRPSVEAQVEVWRRLARQWESDVDQATEAERVMEKRTPGREVDL
jgi:plasmid stability protein